MRLIKLFCTTSCALLCTQNAFAKDAQKTLFGKPVIFEVSAGYGQLQTDALPASLIKTFEDDLAIPYDPEGYQSIDFRGPPFNNIVPLERFFLVTSSELELYEVFTDTVVNFESMSEFGLGLRLQIDEKVQLFARLNHLSFESSKPQNVEYGVDNNFETQIALVIGELPDVGLSFNRTFTAYVVDDVNFSLKQANLIMPEIGLKHDVFEPVSLGDVEIQPYVEVGVGVAFAQTIEARIEGDVPDLVDDVLIFQQTYQSIRVLFNSDVYERGPRTSQDVTRELFDSKPRVTGMIGLGFVVSLSETTSLALETKYRHISLRLEDETSSRLSDYKLHNAQVGVRLSQKF